MSQSSQESNLGSSQHPARRFARRRRLGGFLMNWETATAWASRLEKGEKFERPFNEPEVCEIIDKKRWHGVLFREVGEDEAAFI